MLEWGALISPPRGYNYLTYRQDPSPALHRCCELVQDAPLAHDGSTPYLNNLGPPRPRTLPSQPLPRLSLAPGPEPLAQALNHSDFLGPQKRAGGRRAQRRRFRGLGEDASTAPEAARSMRGSAAKRGERPTRNHSKEEGR